MAPDPSSRLPSAPLRHEAFARRSPRTVQWVAFGISAALHVVALLMYSSIQVRFGSVRPGDESSATRPPSGIEVINLEEVAEGGGERPLEPERQVVPVPVAPRVAGAPGDRPTLEPVAPPPPGPAGPTAAQRLQPGTNDGRLWQPLDPEVVTLSVEERLENLMAADLMTLLDALALEAARAEAATDWTFTDDDGNRWGVSPGKLHLGKITLPLPFGFGLPAGASQDAVRRYLEDAEIRRAAGQLMTDQTLRERAEVMKRRLDAERARRRAESDSSVVRRSGGGG